MEKVALDVYMDIVRSFPVAALFYAMAHRREHVTGAPVAIMRVQLSPKVNGVVSLKVH